MNISVYINEYQWKIEYFNDQHDALQNEVRWRVRLFKTVDNLIAFMMNE